MRKYLLGSAVVAVLALSLAACGKRESTASSTPPAAEKPKPLTVVVVPEAERSKHFVAVNQHLELGGTIYAYVDIDGDAAKLSAGIGKLLERIAATQPQLAPFVKQDYPALFQLLGFNDVRALGVSSVPDGTGYFRNTAFFYTPEKRHGLLAGLGGAPAPFACLNLAPANVDVYAESEVDLAEVYQTVKAVVAKVGGEPSANLMETQLKKAGEAAALSLYGLVTGWKGHSALVLRLEPEQSTPLPTPQPFTIPTPSFLLSVEGIAPAVEPALAKLPMLQAREENGMKIYSSKQPLPLQGIAPVIAVKGTTLYFAATAAFLGECLGNTPRLADTDAFKQALAPLGREGNGLTYVAPRFFTTMRKVAALNPNAPEEAKNVMNFWLEQLPHPTKPLVAVRTNLPDGVLVRSYLNRSMKQDVAALAIYNPVTVGFIAAMAIPAFQKVRHSSQEKAVMNNLRQLSAAADQYYLENGKDAATFDDLVGPQPTKYIKRIAPVDGEDYRKLTFKQGEPLVIFVPSLKKVVRYDP